MSRRESKEDKKKQRQNKKESRKQNTKSELQRVILACEGSVTEKNYFQAIFDNLILTRGIAKTSFVIAKHKHTDAQKLLDDFIARNDVLSPANDNPSTTVHKLVQILNSLGQKKIKEEE